MIDLEESNRIPEGCKITLSLFFVSIDNVLVDIDIDIDYE